MAVIVREKRYIDGKEYLVKVYRTQPGKLVIAEEKKRAEELDHLLSNRVKQAEQELDSLGLLSLKNKRGRVLRLWYEVGRRLSFVMDTSIVNEEDRENVWRALYDYTTLLTPGISTERVERGSTRNHFFYCYRLSTFPREFVEAAGDWSTWSELFDRKETNNDLRIIEWLAEKAQEFNIKSRRNWLRPLTKEIHKKYNKID
ncbi:unnamed protein product, partial [marine sediment metagenome]